MNSREGDWFVDCLVEKWSIGGKMKLIEPSCYHLVFDNPSFQIRQPVSCWKKCRQICGK